MIPYKVYNELPGVGTTSKTLISVIYYNVCNMMGCTPRTCANVQPWQYFLPGANGDARRAQMCSRGNTPCLVPTGTPDGRKCAAVAILLAWCQLGRQKGAKKKNGLQIFCRPGTAKTFYIIHCILQIPDRLPDIRQILLRAFLLKLCSGAAP